MLDIDEQTLEQLRAAAVKAAGNAYAPYSRFRVGAALLFDDGSIATGCNVENLSYGLTSCAERNALFRAISEQGPARRVRAVAVANRDGAPCSPCGACRQVMSEFVTPDAVVCFSDRNGPETRRFAELFPFAFAFDPETEA
ncbi:MAG TPA: cytidine deaminase [Acidobacteriaceae bacterium]|jgi:cytidine deaminase|nr:cytidine deaminase [Acidobacteriaceae bacterium]